MLLGESALRCLSPLVPSSWKRRVKAALFQVPDAEMLLQCMRRLGFAPRTVIDIGAYVGDWTAMCKKIFPCAQVLMVEPQCCRVAELEMVARQHSGVQFRSVLLGARPAVSVAFYEADSGSSVLGESDKRRNPTTRLAMTTLDCVTEGTPFSQPDFMKLDVQGYELEVLKGGEQCVKSAEAVLMEVNLLEVYEGAPPFHTAAAFMAQRGFQIYDFCSFIRRPYDRALWQADVMFVRSSSALVASKRWA